MASVNPAAKPAQSWTGRLPVPYSTLSEITFWTSDMDGSQCVGECAQFRRLPAATGDPDGAERLFKARFPRHKNPHRIDAGVSDKIFWAKSRQ